MNLKKIELIKNSEFEFWLEYLKIINIFAKNPLTPKEKEMMAAILTYKGEEPLYGTGRALIKKQLNMKEQTFAMNKGNLVDKEWLTLDNALPSHLKLVKQMFYEDGKTSISFPINIVLNGA